MNIHHRRLRPKVCLNGSRKEQLIRRFLFGLRLALAVVELEGIVFGEQGGERDHFLSSEIGPEYISWIVLCGESPRFYFLHCIIINMCSLYFNFN